VLIDPDIEDKLFFGHDGLTQLDVEEALDDLVEAPRWDLSDEHGGRVLAMGRNGRQQYVFMSLRPRPRHLVPNHCVSM
jgi:hypothetical protein